MRNGLPTGCAARPTRRRLSNAGSRAVTPRDLQTGSSFALTSETAGKDLVSLWGRGAVSRFDGREGRLTLDGEVVTGMLGADWTRGRLTAGLIVSHSAAEGGYSGAPGAGDGPGSGSGTGGRVEATLTGVFPWGRPRSLGAARGLGRGRLRPGRAHGYAEEAGDRRGRRGDPRRPRPADGGGRAARRAARSGIGVRLPADRQDRRDGRADGLRTRAQRRRRQSWRRPGPRCPGCASAWRVPGRSGSAAG